MQGPSRPPPEQGSRPSSLAELQARRAEEEEAREAEHKYKSAVKKKDRREEREEVNSNRATGKDRLQEKRMEARGSHAAFANRKEENMGLELDESTLGLKDGGDSFQAAIAARDRSQQVRGGRKAAQQEEKQAEMQDKRTEYRKKENDISQCSYASPGDIRLCSSSSESGSIQGYGCCAIWCLILCFVHDMSSLSSIQYDLSGLNCQSEGIDLTIYEFRGM